MSYLRLLDNGFRRFSFCNRLRRCAGRFCFCCCLDGGLGLQLGRFLGADALALLTEWDTYKQPDFRKIKALLLEPVLFDGRNQYSLSEMKALGFRYFSIGRPDVS